MEGKSLHSATGANTLATTNNGQPGGLQHSNQDNKYSYRVGVSGHKKAIFTSMFPVQRWKLTL
jgi:hypothetical protein